MTSRPSARSPRSALVLRLAVGAVAMGLVTVGLGAAGCASPEAPPFDPAALQQVERSAADQVQYHRQAPLANPDYYYNRLDRNDPQNYDPNSQLTEELQRTQIDTGEADLPVGERPVVALPLRECIRRATLNNFDIAVAGYDPAIAETRVTEALARFDPTFQLTSEYQDQAGINPAEGALGDQEMVTLGTSLSQLLPSGGQARLSYQTQWIDLSEQRAFFGPDPAYTSDLTLQFNQPLLRDFGPDVNRARIVINQADQRISVLDFRQRLEEILVQVEETYWQLYQAQREVEIQEELLELTRRTAERIQQRRIEDATRDQIAQALGEVFQRETELIQAQSAVAQLSDQLKALMNDADLPIASNVVIETATDPVTQPLLFDFEDAVDVALLNRPELSQQLLRIDSATTALTVAQSNRLPRLDAILSGGFEGVDEDFGGALEDQFGFDAVTLGIGLQFEIPLGNRAARAIFRRATLQREQAVTQYQALIKQVTLEVAQSQRTISTNYARLRNLRQARLAARDAVEQIEQLERFGAQLTPEFSDRKLRFLATLAAARSAEQAAIAAYNQSITVYERAKGTLLRYNNIVLEEAAYQMNLPAGRVDPVLKSQ